MAHARAAASGLYWRRLAHSLARGPKGGGPHGCCWRGSRGGAAPARTAHAYASGGRGPLGPSQRHGRGMATAAAGPLPSAFKRWAAAGTAGLVAATLLFRQYRSSLWQDEQALVHTDTSKAAITSVERQVPETIRVRRHVTPARPDGTPGHTQEYVVDRAKYTDFVQRSVVALSAAQADIQDSASRILAEELAACFEPIAARGANFADWYFAYVRQPLGSACAWACACVTRACGPCKLVSPLHGAHFTAPFCFWLCRMRLGTRQASS